MENSFLSRQGPNVGPFWLWRFSFLLANICFPKCVPTHPAAVAKSHQSCPTLCDPIDSTQQAPLSLGFSRQECWSGLPFPFPMRESEVAQLCPTLSNLMDCSLWGSSVHGISQAKVLRGDVCTDEHKWQVLLSFSSVWREINWGKLMGETSERSLAITVVASSSLPGWCFRTEHRYMSAS